jgi:hypothetical protein
VSYKVYRDGVVIAQPTATTFTDTGLENGRQYRYEVSQVINGVESSHSAAVLATPVAAVPPPPPPPPDVPPPPPPVAGTHVPTSIDGTGTADVASALKSWLQGLPNGATALLDGKTFRGRLLPRRQRRRGRLLRGRCLAARRIVPFQR